MIRQIDAHDPLLKSVSGHPLLEVGVGGRAACPQPQQDFWVMQQGDEPTGFLCRAGETIYAATTPEYSHELVQFASAVGFSRLVTDLPFSLAHSKLVAMEHSGNLPPLNDRYTVNTFTEPSPDFSAVAFAALQQQCCVLSTNEEMQCYAVSLSHEMRNGRASVATLLIDGQLAAGASLFHHYHGRVELGAVAVLPQYRMQGLAKAVVAALCRLAVQQGFVPLLCCVPALRQLYSSAGFVPLPPLYCYTPIERNN